MYTRENTDGYTDAERAQLNEELAQILAALPEGDTNARIAAEQAHADAVARR